MFFQGYACGSSGGGNEENLFLETYVADPFEGVLMAYHWMGYAELSWGQIGDCDDLTRIPNLIDSDYENRLAGNSSDNTLRVNENIACGARKEDRERV